MKRLFYVGLVGALGMLGSKDAAAAPQRISRWVAITGVATPVTISRTGETVLGDADGWHCVGKIDTSTTPAGKNVDTATISCTKGDLTVRTQARQVDGEPLIDPVPLQIIVGGKPVQTIMFGPLTPAKE
jgi:hypothetical protein